MSSQRTRRHHTPSRSSHETCEGMAVSTAASCACPGIEPRNDVRRRWAHSSGPCKTELHERVAPTI